MPQKKKQNKKPQAKKTAKKSHKRQEIRTVVEQVMPNYASSQTIGHQFNKDHPPFVPILQQQQQVTNNLVSDLLSRVITKIENDGTQQTQQYSQTMQPTNNDNSNSNTSGNTQTVNVYPTVGQSSTTSNTDNTQKSTTQTAAETAITQASGLTAAEAGGIGAGVTAGIGGLFAARNKIGSGITGAISGIKKGFSKAPKTGGTAAESRLLREHDDYIRGTRPGVSTDLQTAGRKPGTYAELPSVPPSPQLPPPNFNKVVEQARKSEVKRELTPVNEIAGGIRTPRPSLDKGSPLNLVDSRTSRWSPKATPINLSMSPQPNYIGSIASQNRSRNSGRLDFSFSSPEVTLGRPSAIQAHNGVQTREIRRQTGEPHVQLEMGTQTEKRPRGRPRSQPETQFSTRSTPFDEAREPRGRGRPRSTLLSQANTPTPRRETITRNITKSGVKK